MWTDKMSCAATSREWRTAREPPTTVRDVEPRYLTTLVGKSG